MKNFLITALLALPVSVFAQDSLKATNSNHKTAKPVYYINGKKAEDVKPITPSAIESMEVRRDQNPPAIYITTKPGHDIFYSLTELIKAFNLPEIEAMKALIVLDGKIIENQKNFLVDSAEIKSVKLSTMQKFNYLPENFRAMKMIDIQLKQPVRIRGLASTGK